MNTSQPKKQMLQSFFRALADEDRLTMIGLLTGREHNIGELAAQLQFNEPIVSQHLSALREVGLVKLRTKGDQQRYTLNDNRLDAWKQMVMDLETISQESTHSDPSWIDDLPLDDFDKKVLKDNTSNGRLLEIPAKHKKLLSVLRWIIMAFEPDITYTEAEVNDLLTTYHEDYATLRRALVDVQFLQRERNGSTYWLTPVAEKIH